MSEDDEKSVYPDVGKPTPQFEEWLKAPEDRAFLLRDLAFLRKITKQEVFNSEDEERLFIAILNRFVLLNLVPRSGATYSTVCHDCESKQAEDENWIPAYGDSVQRTYTKFLMAAAVRDYFSHRFSLSGSTIALSLIMLLMATQTVQTTLERITQTYLLWLEGGRGEKGD